VRFKRKRVYDLVVLFIIFFSLWLSFKSNFPIHLDDWYHLSVIKSFSQKISGWEWWHFAPYGRPYLYSPLFHLIGAFFVRIFNISPIQFIIFCHKISYPLLLFLFWLGVKSFLKEKGALFSVLLVVSFPTSILASLLISPATFIIVAIPWLYSFIQRGEIFKSTLLLTIFLYFHFGMGLLVLLGTLLYLIFYKREKRYFLIILLPLISFSPWLFRLIKYRAYLNFSYQPFGLDLPILIWVLGILGIILSFKKKNNAGIFHSFAIIGLLPWFFHYGDRFWPYATYILCILGAILLINLKIKWIKIPFYFFIIFNLFLTPIISGKGSLLSNFYQGNLIKPGTILMAYELCLTSHNVEIINRDLIELANWIKRNTKKAEIIITPLYPDIFLGEMIYDLTSRRVTSGGWHEVKSKELWRRIQKYIHNAKGFIIVTGVICRRCFYSYSPDPALLNNTIYVKNFGNYYIFLRRRNIMIHNLK
jgi:hypothetical protein